MIANPSVELLIVPPVHDLGDGFHVRRALPSSQRRTVGPFVFFDQMGPRMLRAGGGLDVRPHPHIGLATVTYLFDGEIIHRDSLGTVQPIRPGAVNWMIAGRGIVHSERTAADKRSTGSSLSGIQTWIALPKAQEERAPSFRHHAASELPVIEGEGMTLRLIAGSLFGKQSPVATLSDMFYADVTLTANARLPIAAEHEERAIYVIRGRVDIDGDRFDASQLVVLRPRQAITVLPLSASSRRKRIGARGGSAVCRATRNSFRCPPCRRCRRHRSIIPNAQRGVRAAGCMRGCAWCATLLDKPKCLFLKY